MKVQTNRTDANHFISLMLSSSLIFLSLATRSVDAQSQDSLRHSIGLHSGYLYMANRDDLASPMRYSGGSSPWMLSYDYLGDIHRHSVRLSYRNSQLESAIASNGLHQGEEYGVSTEYAYFHRISILDERNLRTFIGATWENAIDAIKYNYNLRYGGGTTRNGMAYSSLSVTGLAEYRSSVRGTLNARLSIPFVAFAIRPGWAITAPSSDEEIWTESSMKENLVHLILKSGRIVSWNSFRGISMSIGYDYALAPSLDFSMRYAFQYTYYSWPIPMRTVIGQFDVGLSLEL
jgi:hypothetical protein